MPVNLVWKMLFYLVFIYIHHITNNPKCSITKFCHFIVLEKSLLQTHAEEFILTFTCSLIRSPYDGQYLEVGKRNLVKKEKLDLDCEDDFAISNKIEFIHELVQF